MSLTATARAIETGRLLARSLAERGLAALPAHPDLRPSPDAARAAAAAVDAARARGERPGPLAGAALLQDDRLTGSGAVNRALAAGALPMGTCLSAGAAAAALGRPGAAFLLALDPLGQAAVDLVGAGHWALLPGRGQIGLSGARPLSPSLDRVLIGAPGPRQAMQLFGLLAGPDPADPFSDPAALLPLRRAGLSGLVLALPEGLADPAWEASLQRTGTAPRQVPLAGWDGPAIDAAMRLVAGAELALADAPPAGLLALAADAARASATALAAATRRLALLRPGLIWAMSGAGALLAPLDRTSVLLSAAVGLPAIGLPSRLGPLQMIGPRGSELRLAALAAALDRAL